MNLEQVEHAVTVSNNKPECLMVMGLEQTNENFIELSYWLRKYQIDTKHFIGVKAEDYVNCLRGKVTHR